MSLAFILRLKPQGFPLAFLKDTADSAECGHRRRVKKRGSNPRKRRKLLFAAANFAVLSRSVITLVALHAASRLIAFAVFHIKLLLFSILLTLTRLRASLVAD